MGYSARLLADPAGLSDRDAARLVEPGVAVTELASSSPGAQRIEGWAMHDGRAIALTLDVAALAPRIPEPIVPEHIAIAAIVAASFLVPLYHWLG